MVPNNRIIIVDALRGIALLLIVLIHYVEHFDFFMEPSVHYFFSAETDRTVLNLVFLLISGKAYSIFALLFGFSFYIQMLRNEEKGLDFRGRFLWRLIVLLIFGFIHSLIYKGDILHIYALLGIPLIFIYKARVKTLMVLSILLALQIPLLINFFQSVINPDFVYEQTFGAAYWQEGNQLYAAGSFTDVLNYNLWKGRATVWGWTYYNGRYIQLLSLFVAGFLVGRHEIFKNILQHKQLLYNTLIGSLILAVTFIGINSYLSHTSFNPTQNYLLTTVVTSYANLSVTAFIVSGITLLYLNFKEWPIFNMFAYYGRMSLTNYVVQALIGVTFFYGFGLAMYRFLGSTWSIIFGTLVFLIQTRISKLWLKHFYYGPLEWLWRAITFFNFNINMRRK